MKIKDGYILQKIGEQNAVVAIGDAALVFNGIILLNDTGAFLWEQLKTDKTEEQLVELLINTYEVDTATAQKDVDAFIEILKAEDFLL